MKYIYLPPFGDELLSNLVVAGSRSVRDLTCEQFAFSLNGEFVFRFPKIVKLLVVVGSRQVLGQLGFDALLARKKHLCVVFSSCLERSASLLHIKS